ncbi:MAG: DUF2341 domain-containing protein [bacterium]|nr:DUF2341 domain-containing protein [bacterium]
MKSDISRDTFQAPEKYTAVRLQQGRALVDADWNEQADIRAYQDRRAASDAIGASGAPAENPGLGIAAAAGGTDLEAAPGRYYIEGIVRQTDQTIAFTAQPDLPGYALPTEDGVYLAYAGTREALVTALEDPELLDPALGGFDTTARSRSLLQLGLLRDGDVGDVPDCLAESAAWTAFRDGERSENRARMKARLAPNATTGQAGEYAGEQNALYRVEIHRGGAGGVATYKWSRANAAEVLEWTGQNGDVLTVRSATGPRQGFFAPGDWLEVLDDSFELTGRSGGLVQILADDGDSLRIKADSYIPHAGGGATLDIAEFTGELRKLRRWSMSGDSGELQTSADATEFLAIEHGLEIAFTSETISSDNVDFRAGEAWLIPARAIPRDIEWPVQSAVDGANDFIPPMFPQTAFARLAYVQLSGGVWSVLGDCRRIFPTLADANLVYQGGDGQEGLPGEFLDEALVVRVASGSVPVCDARVRFTIVAGDTGATATLEDVLDAANTGASVDVLTDGEGLAAVRWRIDPTTAQPRVSATLLDADGTPLPLLVEFNAGLSVAARLQHTPEAVLDPAGLDLMAGVTTVREALDALENIKADRAGDTITGSLTIDEDLTVEGQLTVQGDVIAKDLAQTPGDVLLGDQDSDRITIHGELKSQHITDALVVDDAMQVREDLLVDGAVGPRSGIGIGEITGDWKFRVAMNVASPIVDAPFSRRSQQLYASDARIGAAFASSFAVHGDWLMAADATDASRAGAVYAFQRVDGEWVERQKITASDSGVDKRFGMRVAIEGDLMVVGSHPENATASTGSVYVFELNDGEWREIQQVVASDAAVGDQFGAFVAISGTTVLAGSPRKNGFAGAAYAFRIVGGVLQEEAKMTPPAPAANDIFGVVAVDGDTAVIGAYSRSQAFVYQRIGQGWVYQQTLSGAGETWFGISVAIDGNQIVVGAPYESGNTTDEGATYIFEFDGSTWSQAARITALDGHAANRYGQNVDINGDTVLVGARGNNNTEGTEAGAVYVLKKEAGVWSQETKFILNDDSAFSGFGSRVQLEDGVAYVANSASNSSAAPRHRTGSLTVIPRTPESLTNYQYELTINTASLVSAGKMNADGSDILFMNSDDLIPLPYWIESGMNTAATKIWVRLPSIPAGGLARIFLHYGNENAVARSSTAETFMGEIEDLGAAWQIEEGAGTLIRDLSGNGNDGTMQGVPVWTDGRFGSALDFNGSNNEILLPPGNLAGTGSDPVSISMWFYSDNDWAVNETRTPWQFAWDSSQFYSVFWNRGGTQGLNIHFRESIHIFVPIELNAILGRWNHFVGVYTGGDKRSTNSFIYYLNGIRLPLGSINEGEVGDGPPYDSRLGSSANALVGLQYWDGRLNHMQVYRRALTDSEVADLSHYYGYATLENPGRILLRTYAETAPIVAIENELPVPFALPEGWQYRKSISIQNDFPESFSEARRSVAVGAFSTLLAEAGDQLLVGSFLEGSDGVVRVLERDAAGFYTEVQSFTGSGLTGGAGFGGSIAVDGDRAAIGAGGQNGGQGAVFVYERQGGVWYETAQLVGDAPGDANLGGDVAIAGDYIFGGGESPSQSQVRVFYKDPTSGWSQTQLLTTSESNPADRAWQLAAYGDVAIVGAFNNIEGGSHVGGAVFVFRLDRETSVWSEVQKLVPSVRNAGDRFGIFPSMHGTTMVIGADEVSIGNGAAYVFELEDGRWVETAKLTDPDGALGDRFGFRTRVSHDTIVAGSEFKHVDGFSDTGVAFVFTRTASGWTPGIEIKAGDFSRDNLFFGYDVEIVGDSIFASTFPGTGVGEVFQFERLRPESVDDVQVLIELDTTNLIADQKLSLQGDDFLITDEDGLTPLPYYVEAESLNSRATKIWARVPGLRAGESKQIFLHYGNPETPARSSAQETFVRVVDGIAAAYSFDSITKARIFDESGNGNEGLAGGGPIYTAGVFENALEFDGVNDYVDVGNTVSTNIRSDITLSCWFRCDAPGTGTDSAINGMLISKHLSNGTRSYSIDVAHTNNRTLNFGIFDTGDVVHGLLSNTSIEYGKWYHVVGTYDRASGNQSIYINGVLDAQQSIGQINLQQTTTPLLLGAQSASGGQRRRYLDGALDQPRVYARSLSAEEVRDLFENRADARIAGNTRSEMVRRSLRATPPVLPAPTEDRIAFEFPESWSVRQAIRIDNRAAVSTNFTKLSAANLDELDYLGGQVFVGDDFAFAGAIGDDELGSGAGAVYVYRREAEINGEDRWLFDAKLTASDGSASHVFGANLSFDGVSLIVTAQGGGRCYIFVRENGAWTEQEILTPSSAASSFGYSAWIDGDLAVVGDHTSDAASTDAGAAYVFRRSGASWSEEAILSHPSPGPTIGFGSAVSISAETGRVAVGCRGDGGSSVNRGAVYLFDFDGSTWQRGAELVADDAANGDQLGESMGMSGDTVVAGAYLKNSSTGAAYVFRQRGDAWIQEAKLTASDGVAGDELSVEIAISGDRILAGARQPSNGPGKAYIFRRDERNNWTEERILKGDGTINGFLFGTVVSIGAKHALVGHRANGVQNLSRGAAYLFELNEGETDIQTELSIDTAALIGAGQMQSDCGDLLFTDADGRGRLAHWIESGKNTADTKVWVRLPYIPYAQTKTIYMHAGNPLARSRSSLADTFVRKIDGVLAAYDFEEDSGTSIVDRSGNGFDGTLQSGASRTAGKFGSSLALNGAGQYASLPPFPGRDNIYDFTVSIWARLDVVTSLTGSGGRHYLFDFRGDGTETPDSIGLYLEHSGGGQLDLISSLTYAPSTFSASQNPVSVIPGVWNHYVLRRRGNQLENFFNGEKLAYIPPIDPNHVPVRLTPANFSHGKRVGIAGADTSLDWHGALDALRIYDRALSDAEIHDAHRNFSDVDPERSVREVLRKRLDNPPLIETAVDGATRRIVPGDAANLDSFATGIGVSGDIVAVGSPDDDDDGSASGSGYLYRRHGDQFGLMQKVRPNDPAANARFGATAAVGGEDHQFAFFGARSSTTFPAPGTVYVYKRDRNQWREHQKLQSSSTTNTDGFGAGLAARGDYLAVGAPYHDLVASDGGAVFIYHREGDLFVEQAILTANDAEAPDGSFGFASLGFNDQANVLVVSAYLKLEGGSASGGAVYIFTRDGNSWSQQAKLISDDRVPGDNFGRWVDIAEDGKTVAIGANDEGTGGAVYIFENDPVQGWVQKTKLTADDGAGGDRFGQCVGLSGGTLAVGAGEDNTAQGTNAGSLYLYRRRGGDWVFDKKYEPEESAVNAQYATRLAMDAEFIYAGNAPVGGTATALQSGVLFAIRHGAERRLYESRPPAQGWLYSEAIELNAKIDAPITVTDYQVPIEIDTTDAIARGRMQPDGSDIAIFAADGVTEINHWIESGINTSATKIWIKVPSISGGDTIRVLLRYGFAESVSRSSVADTFVREITDVRAAYVLDSETGATTVADASANGNPATIVGAVPTGGPAVDRGALLFDGQDDHVLIPDNPQLDVTGNLTLSAVFRCDGPGTGAEAATGSFIISRELTSGDAAYGLLIRHGTRRLDFELWSPGLSVLTSNTVVNYGQWYHVACTYDPASGEARLYINGQLDNSANFGTLSISTPDRSALLGAYFGSADETMLRGFLKGAIAQAGIYAKTFSPDEVADQHAQASLFVAARPGRELIRKTAKVSLDDVILALNFNEGPGGTLTDRSGSGNTASLFGPQWSLQSVRGYSLDFNGINSYAQAPVSWPAIGTGDFSISIWVNMDVIDGDYRVILSDQIVDNFQFGINNVNSSLKRISLFLGAAGFTESEAITLPLGQWHQIGATRRSGLVTFYRNGEIVSTIPNGASVATSSYLDIGYRSTNNFHPVDGRLDELQIYNRALSNAEMRDRFENPGLPLESAIPVTVEATSERFAVDYTGARGIGESLAAPVAWNYRQAIAIDNTAGAALTDYQQLLIVDTATPVREGKVRADLRDLLFVDEGGSSELNYWIESGANSEATRVWVKVPTIPANGVRTIYMYYGNRATYARSSLSGVFVREIPGLTMALQMDEASDAFLLDSSGNANTLDLISAPRVAGNFGSAISLNGTSGYAIRNPYAEIPSNEITVEFWMRSADTSRQGALFSYKLDPNPTGIDEMTFTTNAGLPSYTFQTNNNTAVGGAVVSDNLWHHVAVTWRGQDGEVVFYKDGVETSRDTISVGYALPAGGALVLGQEQDSVGGGFNPAQSYEGLIEGFRVYDRVLTAEEVADAAANYAFATPELPGRTLVRQFAQNAPTVSAGGEEETEFVLLNGPYRRPIVIDRENETESLADYQVLLTIDSAALIAENKTAPDLSDVYFTADDGETQLPFWIESGVGTANTRIWIRVPQIPAGEITSVYMYYGESGRGGDSSAEGTFVAAIEGVAAAYSFDEGAGTLVADSSGNANTGTLTNGPDWTAGQRGGALLFDGQDDYVTIPNSPSVSLTTNISLAAWIRVDGPGTGLQSGPVGYLINKHHTNTNESYATYFNHATRQIVFQVFEAGNITHELTSNRVFNYGQWYFMTGTYDNATGEQRLFFDGVLDASQNEGSFAIAQTTLSVTIGAFFQTPETELRSFLNGAIDEPRIYDAALTPVQVEALYRERSFFSANHPGREFVRRIAASEPALAVGGEEQFPFVTEQEGWPYRIPVTVDNSAGANALNEFQVAIQINTLGPISEGKMQLDGRDLLVTDSDAITQVPFWIEGPMNSVQTKLWVRLPAIAANTRKTIYVFYGNAQATALSNRANVFEREVPNVVAGYSIDEVVGNTLPDLSGNGYDGTIDGATPVAGRAGQALSFDGDNDFVSLPAFGGSQATLNDFTIGLWVNLADHNSPPDGISTFLDLRGTGYNPSAPESIFMKIHNTGAGIEVHHGIEWPTVPPTWTEYAAPIPDPVGQWTQFVFARSGSETRVYVDGVRLADTYESGAQIVPPQIDPVPFSYTKRLGTVFGVAPGADAHWTNGLIEALRFYDRALTDEEISDLFQERGHLSLEAPGVELVHKYAANEPLTSAGPEENIPYQENSAEIRLSIDGVIESRSGGFRFPDGSVQISASSEGVVFPAAHGLLNESPYAPDAFVTNSGTFKSAIDFPDWRNRAAMPFAVRAHSSVNVDGRLHILGGRTEPGTLRADHLRYDPQSDEWEVLVSMNVARQYTRAVELGGRIHMIGGLTHFSNIVSTTSHEVYDPASNSWQNAAPLPEPLHTTVTNVTPDGLIHVIGGRGNTTTYLDVHYVYDSEDDSWHKAAPMPTARGTMDAIVDNAGQIHVIGGYNGNISVFRAEHEVYDPGTDAWRTMAPLPIARHHHRMFLIDDSIYLFGGTIVSSAPQTVDVYSMRHDSWSTIAGSLTGFEFAASRIGDTIYATGGVPDVGVSTSDRNLARSFARTIYMHQRRPVPALDGAISIAAVTSNSVTLRWAQAPTAGLSYRVFYAHEANLRTPDEIEANGIPIGAGAIDAGSILVPGLATGAHYFNVLVEDGVGTRAAYEMTEPVLIA